jgi:hypothetical protein
MVHILYLHAKDGVFLMVYTVVFVWAKMVVLVFSLRWLFYVVLFALRRWSLCVVLMCQGGGPVSLFVPRWWSYSLLFAKMTVLLVSYVPDGGLYIFFCAQRWWYL